MWILMVFCRLWNTLLMMQDLGWPLQTFLLPLVLQLLILQK